MLNEALYKLGAEPAGAEEAAKLDRQFADLKELIFQLHRIEAENSDRLTEVESDIKALKGDVREIRHRQTENIERLAAVESGITEIRQRQESMGSKLDVLVGMIRDHVVPEVKTGRPEDWRGFCHVDRYVALRRN